MRRKLLALLLMTAITFCWMGAMTTKANAADDVSRMTIKELKGRLGAADLVVVDVRAGGSWEGSDSKIKGAVREDPTAVQSWIQKYSEEKTLVLYCS